MSRITHSDIIIFTRHLSTLISAGIPLILALESIASFHHNPAMKRLLFTLQCDLLEGRSLAQCFKKFPSFFDSLYCQLIHAAEQSGTLDIMLKQMADSLEKTASLRKKIKKALTYPAALLVLSILVSVFLMLVIVPEFEALFSSFGATLPPITRFLITLSNFFLQQCWALMIFTMIAIVLTKYSLSHSIFFKSVFEKIIFRFIFLGPVMQKALLIKFSSTLAILLNAGTPLIDAINLLATIINTSAYQKALIKIREQIISGQSFQNALNESHLFPPIFIQLIGAGENTGSLGVMLEKIVTYYEEELDQTITNFNQLLEPIIMLILGGIVGSLVIALYLPIFRLGSIF